MKKFDFGSKALKISNLSFYSTKNVECFILKALNFSINGSFHSTI